ncbi:MAG: SDR family oxidoreductase [Saccharospirillaceae bacterium]|nr:SDR family oxidoreductase [Pseudomonadales bacterium]NRB77460.1 SDR family oxidoreductase [Saccharospirillaceae bacterium]
MMNFKNQHVVITGATSGIGLTIAENFYQAGAQVTIIGRSKVKLAKLKNFTTHCIDLSDQQSVLQLTNQIKQPVDHLINNAAIAEFTEFSACTVKQLNDHIAVNLVAPFLITQQILPLLRKGGSILNISSYFSNRMLHDRPSSMYSLTKGGLDSLTKALAFELGPKQIRVNAIAPGTVDTPLFRANIDKLSTEQKEKFNAQITKLYPLGRIGNTDDIANLALFISSPMAKWMTGSIINIDGGLTTH